LKLKRREKREDKMGQARFVLSLDCEFLWGSHMIGGTERFPYLRSGFTAYYDNILQLLEKYDIRATFAFVGSMGLSLDEFSSLETSHLGEGYHGWHQYLIQYAKKNSHLWFAPLLLKRVSSANPQHEIASHSLTHICFDDPRVDHSIAKFEFEKSRVVISATTGHNVKTFIFPANRIAHLTTLGTTEYQIFRGDDETWYRALPGRKMWHFLDQALPFAPKSVQVTSDSKSKKLCVPGSLLLFAYDGTRSIIPDYSRIIKIRQGIDRSIRESKIFHLWFHPWNLGSSTRMFQVLESVLAFVAAKRDKQLLQVVAMGDLV
jgi:peptidoglycan/xylan/chitin deacetylase (PgdA/CDA1 family)